MLQSLNWSEIGKYYLKFFKLYIIKLWSLNLLDVYKTLKDVISSVLPRIDPFSFGESPIFAGESAQVNCFASQGDLPMEIVWSFNGEMDLSSFGVSTMSAGKRGKMLLIESVASVNRGQYNCTAKNLAGSTTFSAYLEIHGKPVILSCFLVIILNQFLGETLPLALVFFQKPHWRLFLSCATRLIMYRFVIKAFAFFIVMFKIYYWAVHFFFTFIIYEINFKKKEVIFCLKKN